VVSGEQLDEGGFEFLPHDSGPLPVHVNHPDTISRRDQRRTKLEWAKFAG
jgi:hypothetical protein